MRGSVYHQTANLVKVIFVEGSKKEQRADPTHKYYQCIASYNTIDTYRRVWNNFFNYLREHWKIKNCELIDAFHVKAYFEYYPSKQYAEKISSALGKLEIALNKYSKMTHKNPKIYDFSIRQDSLDNARDLQMVANNYKNRTYRIPEIIIKHLSTPEHQLAASIQLEGGARAEGVLLIKRQQLKGYKTDTITQTKVSVIETKEKGGKIGDVLISTATYKKLEQYFIENQKTTFKLKYQNYENDIIQACQIVGEKSNGSHGFRWTFAQNRVRKYQKYSYTYEQALQGVSWEMKHFRASITEHYLGV